jgi:hypothetical protein
VQKIHVKYSTRTCNALDRRDRKKLENSKLFKKFQIANAKWNYSVTQILTANSIGPSCAKGHF